MFQSKLSCENCSYSTEPFVGVYVPSSDSTEVVLQDQESKKIRVLELRGIAEMLPPHPSEEQLDERIRQLCEANRQQNEKRVDTWVVPDEFEAIECPCCGKQLVRLQLLSII